MTALGLLSSIAFSASYQMVAHFANKNTIALGLGCAGSGVLVLALELGLDLGGDTPKRWQLVSLFELSAGESGPAAGSRAMCMPGRQMDIGLQEGSVCATGKIMWKARPP